jgi:hypothetical protein
MPLYLQFLEGENSVEAQPLLATGDPEVVRSAAQAIIDRLKSKSDSRLVEQILDVRRRLESVDSNDTADGGAP